MRKFTYKKDINNPEVVEVRGNNGGNYVRVEKLSDRYLELEVGHCCVKTIRVKISAEALSNFLTEVYLRDNKDFLDVVRGSMNWTAEINEKFFGESCNLDGCGKPIIKK